MAEVRRRRVSASRPRDREETDDEDVTRRPARRTATKTTSTAPASRRARDEDEDEEEDEQPRRRSSSRSGAPARSSRRTHEAEEDAPRRGLENNAVKSGWGGAEEVRKSGPSGMMRLELGPEPELIKFLEPEPFASFRQHWVQQGRSERPYACIGVDCPLCELGAGSTQTTLFNVLLISGESGPELRYISAGNRLVEVIRTTATPRGEDKPKLTLGYFEIEKSGGRDGTSQTNLKRIKERDLAEDWSDLEQAWEDLEDPITFADLPEVVKDAKNHVYTKDRVQMPTQQQLRQLADFLSGESESSNDGRNTQSRNPRGNGRSRRT